MALVVQKYGGTSVGDPGRLKVVADRVVAARQAGDDVVVVVSAMGKTTEQLIELSREVTTEPPQREMDMLLTAGERVSMALLAMAVFERGQPVISLTGSQAGILTDSRHGAAKIVSIGGGRIRESLDHGRVVIVAGFQGVDPVSREVTTLGRGGSDATAVALAAGMGAHLCEIYTDVDGVFTADPRIVPRARKLAVVSYEEMLELAAAGAGVLMERAVEFGRRFRVPIHVRSSFSQDDGTWVRERGMERAIVSGIAHDVSHAKVTVAAVPDQPGIAAELFAQLADRGVAFDMIVQNVSSDGATDISFTVPRGAADLAREAAEAIAASLGAGDVDVDLEVAKVSLVGAGMNSQPGIAARMFTALGRQSINIQMISTSAIRISCVVSGSRIEDAVRAIHDEFDALLGATDVGA